MLSYIADTGISSSIIIIIIIIPSSSCQLMVNLQMFNLDDADGMSQFSDNTRQGQSSIQYTGTHIHAVPTYYLRDKAWYYSKITLLLDVR